VSSRSTAVVVVSALAIAGIAFAIWPESEPREPTGSPAPAPAPAVPAPVPAAAGVTGPAPAPAPKSTMLKLPDGSEVAPLNGVLVPAAMVWGDRPWSPIVRIDHTTIDWYVHADGSLSTTLEVFRKDLGRKDPVTIVAKPTEVMPIEVDGKIIPLPDRKGGTPPSRQTGQ
jgi:hypothetical protein